MRRRHDDRAPDAPKTAILVCSPGGHLQQMLSLEPAWGDCERTWVSLRAADSEQLLADENVVWASGPTNRSLTKLVRNAILAWRVLRTVRPDAVLSTGAALAVPFLLLGRLFGARVVYVESFTRTEGLSMAGKMVYPFVSAFFVQWPTTAPDRPKAQYVGSIL
jgi:beta-1,4-N-acetylglucosaminyltransferase